MDVTWPRSLLLLAMATCLGLIVCSFLPWLTVTYTADLIGAVKGSTSGNDLYSTNSLGDGQVVASAALFGGVIALIGHASPGFRVAAGHLLFGVGLLALAIAAHDMFLAGRSFDYQYGYLGTYPEIGRAYGLWLTAALSAALSLIGVVLALADRPEWDDAELYETDPHSGGEFGWA